MKKHKCIECDNLVFRKTALRCRSCANRYIAKNRDKSYWKSKEFANRVSKLTKERLKNPKNHPNYKDGRSVSLCKCIDCGEKLYQKHLYEAIIDADLVPLKEN